MKELLDKVLKTEESAKHSIEAASQKARLMVEQAQLKARQSKEQERQLALARKDELLSKAGENAMGKKRLALKDASQRADALLKEFSGHTDAVAEKFFRSILKSGV